MTELLSIFTAFGLSFSAGLNAYIPLFIIGSLAHYTDVIHLTKPWDTRANPYVLIFLAVLIIVEFLADKVPAFNHVNDAIQTFIRPTAGAIAFAATAGIITNIHPALALACGMTACTTDEEPRAGESPQPAPSAKGSEPTPNRTVTAASGEWLLSMPTAPDHLKSSGSKQNRLRAKVNHADQWT